MTQNKDLLSEEFFIIDDIYNGRFNKKQPYLYIKDYG